MDKMREEFEAWASEFFGILFDGMTFSKDDFDAMERYHCISDDDGAFVVTGMFYAWKASRSSLCIDLPSKINDRNDSFSCGFDSAISSAEVSLENAGVQYK